jgi:hypothetical protein
MQLRDLERNIDSVRASAQPDFKQAQSFLGKERYIRWHQTIHYQSRA